MTRTLGLVQIFSSKHFEEIGTPTMQTGPVAGTGPYQFKERVQGSFIRHERVNEATQAWVELEYNCSIHSETRQTPIERLLCGPSVVRDAPSTEELRRAFRLKVERKQRHSDGTVSIASVRFEVPSQYRHLDRLTLRYARWDLSSADLWDDSLGLVLATIYPVDREANASGFRRPLAPVCSTPLAPRPSGMAPLLRHYVEQHRQTGLPPAYLPKDDLSFPERV